MKKTRISFKDIKPGDLIEVVDNINGVKVVETGIAFEAREIRHGFTDWLTSQGGLLISDATYSDEDGTLYRIDVSEVQFDDLRKGDKVRVTTKVGTTTTIIEDEILVRVDEAINPYWCGRDARWVVFKYAGDGQQEIEILERIEDNG